MLNKYDFTRTGVYRRRRELKIMIKNSDCVVLVTSCYNYRDVLDKFEFFFKKHWLDCPFEVWLNIDKEIKTNYKYNRVIISDHPQNLVRMRDIEFTTPYVLMMQDDHWLIEDVSNDEILKCIDIAKKYNCGNLRLLRDPKTEEVFSNDEELYIYRPGKAYRISARGGLWNTEYLKGFIRRFDDFWQMERFGQEYSNSIDMKVLATKYRCLPIIDAVHKGKYEDYAMFMLDANGIEIDRAVMSAKERLIDSLKSFIFELNPDVITKIQATLNIGYKPKYK